jgi:PKD repeat protein
MNFFQTINAGSNVVYHWNFGDGQTANGAAISHIYTATGTYTATVTATNGAGSIPATTLVIIEPIKVYLPLILNRY